MKQRESVFLLLLAALWGGSFLFIRLASPALGPVFLMDTRVWLAGIALLLYAVFFARIPHLRRRWKAYLLLGTLNAALPFTLIAFAELHLPASLAAILNATTPLFTTIIAFVWLHDPMTAKKLLGVVLGVIGVIVLVGWSSFPLTPPVLLSIGASLLAACFYGIGGVYSKRAFEGEPPLALAIGQQLGAGIVLLPFAGASIPAHTPSFQIVLALLALALFSTSIGYLLYFHLMTSIGPTGTLSVTFLVPVFGLLWGAVFLKESLSPGWLLGLAIILLGMYFVTNIHLALPQFSSPRPHQEGAMISPTQKDE